MSTIPPPGPGSDPAARAAAWPPPQVIVERQPPTALGRYGKYVVIALVLAVMTIVGQSASYRRYFSPSGGPQEKFHSLSESADKKIAIIDVEGAILDGEGFVKQQIERVRKDEDVVAVVLHINSPGGTVTASDYLLHHLRELKRERNLPMVVSMGSLCASGGYYLAMAVGETPDVIYAEPSTWTGSIGVVIPHYDVSGLLENWNVKDDSVVSHKYKLMGSPTQDLTPEEKAEDRKLLQDLVDESFARFKDIVLAGRPKLKADEESLKTATTGRIFTTEQALDLGLVDKKGFIEDAIARAAELANVDPDDVRCVKYDEPPTTLGTLLGAESGARPAAKTDLAAILDLTAPRAYYLCTWLPAVLANEH